MSSFDDSVTQWRMRPFNDIVARRDARVARATAIGDKLDIPEPNRSYSDVHNDCDSLIDLLRVATRNVEYWKRTARHAKLNSDHMVEVCGRSEVKLAELVHIITWYKEVQGTVPFREVLQAIIKEYADE